MPFVALSIFRFLLAVLPAGQAQAAATTPAAATKPNQKPSPAPETNAPAPAPEPDDTLAAVRKSGRLRVGIISVFFPFEMKKASGAIEGFDIDMMRSYADSLGVRPEFVDTRWDGLIPGLHAKKFDVIISGITVTNERAKQVLFSDHYYKAGLAALIPKKYDGIKKRIEEFDDPKYTVGVYLATTADTFAAKRLKRASIKKFENDADGSAAILTGKVDAYISDRPYILIMGRKNAGRSVVLDTLESDEYLALAARKSDERLVSSFNAFLRKWKEIGEYDKHLRKYFVEMAWLKDFPDLQ